MARNSLLVASFAVLAVALIPPCPPGLGPEFCPLTVRQDDFEVSRERAVFPGLTQQDALGPVFSRLNKTRMEADLRGLTDPTEFPNRYCFSRFGERAYGHVVNAVQGSMNSELGSTAVPPRTAFFTVPNHTPQLSYIASILAPGHIAGVEGPLPLPDTIVVGAHMDSINHRQDKNDEMVAPGVDDNGTGTVVLLEVLRALMPLFSEKPVKNEVQFHWYAAEEIGLHGSKPIFKAYKKISRPVKAMLNLDMVGYSGAHKVGSPIIAVQKDQYVHENLTAFTEGLVRTYSKAKVGYAMCRYACSDHASAHKAGFPAAMIGESSYVAGSKNPYIHSANDTIDHVDFDYMLEFAKVTAAFIVELAYTDF